MHKDVKSHQKYISVTSIETSAEFDKDNKYML